MITTIIEYIGYVMIMMPLGTIFTIFGFLLAQTSSYEETKKELGGFYFKATLFLLFIGCLGAILVYLVQ